MFFGLLAASSFLALPLGRGEREHAFTRVLSLAVRSIIIVFVLSIVFEELGLAEQTMLVCLRNCLRGLMLAWQSRSAWGQRLGQAFSGEEDCSREEERGRGERRRTVAALAPEVSARHPLRVDEISFLLHCGG